MFKAKFTTKITLLAIIPITIFFATILGIQIFEMEKLSKSTSNIARTGLEDIYRTQLATRSNDIAGKVSLKIDNIYNELNIITGMAQKIIDEDGLTPLGRAIQDIPYLANHFEYNTQKNWSNLKKSDIDISMSVWGYLHDEGGRINQNTINYTTSISSIKILLHAVGHFGMDKGWLYLTGPKETPVMVMTPWSQMPSIFDKKYPGHNTNNWWDFFFPGIVEGWEAWISNPSLKPKNESGEITLTPLYEDAGGTGLMVTFFSPLWNTERTKNYGAAALDFNIHNLISLVENEKIGQTGFSFLLQSDGNALGMQDSWVSVLGLEKKDKKEGGVNKIYFKFRESRIEGLRELANVISEQNFSINEFIDNTGKEYVISFRNIVNYNLWTGNGQEIKEDALYLGMVVPKDEILQVQYQIEDEIESKSTEAMVFIVSISIVFGIFTVVIAAMYAIRETKQIRMMTDSVTSVKDKNFNVMVPIVSKDDLGELAHTFNGMITEIQATYSQLQKYAKDLEEEVKERTQHLQQANERLERLSNVDGLTNVHNRRYFDDQLDKNWRNHVRNGLPLSVLLIDIDYFKKFNDTYGHQAGDSCLIQVALALQNTLKRPSDILARYGGEEFCAIISGDADDAMKIGALLIQAVETLHIEHQPSDKGIVSISIGVHSLIPTQNDDMSKFVELADQALYESKKTGRDRVTLYS
ncbi:diguanylate cyclase domain-containing protein [Desulfobacter latus]|uniref:diguanylate cyclase n=1 Tax=Desulfobacter latus TaxID=2292 RepID=A0A850TEZ6_9BACT|nr:diguanylate cyclase [Desulfobacter latus]NWH06847.1 diguanylate cyclase [Desulfobacter latus]